MIESLIDPERELALSYAPGVIRPYLRTLWMIDERFGAIVAGTSDSTIGEMRLLWWREAISTVTEEPRSEPLLEQVSDALAATGAEGAAWGSMAEGWHAFTAAPDSAGDTWTWTAIDSDSKLIVSYMVGGRDSEYAIEFMDDLRDRLANRVQLTTDGHKAYLEAVEGAFGGDVDYAQLIKMYGGLTGQKGHEKKYSPAECTGIKKRRIEGEPVKSLVSTSHVERQNLTMRMHMRRFTRLTNAFSKKVENHAYAVALHFMYYNFVRIHQTLKVTPAMAAGLTDRLWDIGDLVALVDADEPAPKKRGRYKKRISK